MVLHKNLVRIMNNYIVDVEHYNEQIDYVLGKMAN